MEITNLLTYLLYIHGNIFMKFFYVLPYLSVTLKICNILAKHLNGQNFHCLSNDIMNSVQQLHFVLLRYFLVYSIREHVSFIYIEPFFTNLLRVYDFTRIEVSVSCVSLLSCIHGLRYTVCKPAKR